MKQCILGLTLTLLGGFTARASVVTFNGAITGGSATRDGAFGSDFTASIQGLNFSIHGEGSSGSNGPNCMLGTQCVAPESYFMHDGAAGPVPDGFSPYSGGGFFSDNGTFFGCAVSSGFHGPNNTCGFDINIFYTLNIPDPGASPPNQIFLTTPVTVLADVGGYDASGNAFSLTATGAGIATITLQCTSCTLGNLPPLYFVQTAQYDFTPVPEPATVTLAGLGLLAVIALRRRARG